MQADLKRLQAGFENQQKALEKLQEIIDDNVTSQLESDEARSVFFVEAKSQYCNTTQYHILNGNKK